MKPKEAIEDLWKKGYFESVRTTGEIDKELSGSYKVSTTNLTAVLRNCKKFLRRMGKARWRQTGPYDVRITNGNKELNYFALLGIHPKIQKVSERLFHNKHYPEAVFAAFKQVEIMVKEKTAIKGKYGTSLMQEVFSANDPILRLNGSASDSDDAEQRGFMMLFSGALLGIKDPKSHSDIVQDDPIIALQYLGFASILCRMIDKSTKVK